MPLIDVSELLVDPDFCEEISVIRRTQVIGDYGNASTVNQTLPVIAVVTALDGDVIRQTDAEFARADITVHSQTRLFGVENNNMPDIVVWAGNNYVVKRPNNWSHFGVGFTAAVCSLRDASLTS